ncbi:hypothetical protein MUP01_10800 [Candidatus Bathyarchaeota archaeon]|nr:hypothetical protein [Candidatus Bathyarchaeota archaeon]
MRPKYLVGVIVGLLLVYLSFFGLSGFGLALLPDTPENLTTYTRVDSGGYLSVTSSSVTVTNMPRSAVSYVYKNFGASHFGDFHMQFEAQATAIQSGTGILLLTLANNIGPSVAMTADTIGFGVGYNSSGYFFILGDGRVVGGSTSRLITTDPLALYYFDLSRASSQLTLGVFTSSAYSGPIMTLTCTAPDMFQYLYVCQSLGVVGSTPTVSGKTQNLRIAGGGTPPPPPGTYNLNVNALYADASNVWQSFAGVTPVVVSGQASKATPATWPLASGTYTVTVPSSYGSYTFKFWSDSVTNTNPQRSVTIGPDLTVTACYTFGTTPPPPPPPDTGDFLTMIKNFFNLLPVKSLFLVSGLASTIGCGIMFMLPGKGARSRPAAYYSPY